MCCAVLCCAALCCAVLYCPSQPLLETVLESVATAARDKDACWAELVSKGAQPSVARIARGRWCCAVEPVATTANDNAVLCYAVLW